MSEEIKDIRNIEIFQAPYVKLRNASELTNKLNQLIRDGKKNLQIVTDFDCTLTKQCLENGKKHLTSFGMFSECPSIPDTYREEDRKLCEKYKPIEVDPHLSVEQKAMHMEEWYKAANKMLLNIKFPSDELNRIGKDMADNFRDSTNNLITRCADNGIPMLVFSAGLGDAVVAAMKGANFLLPNVKVISNFLALDDNDLIVGLKGKIIHVYNKNEAAIKDTEYYTMVKDRSNVLVMGDSIGDANMADGMEHCEVAIKIGFLYHNAEEFLPKYLEHFDIVLIDDQTMDIPNALLKLVY